MAVEGPPAKRARLSMACNECRRRKVKCDAEYPKCRNCTQRNHECFTSDSRRPDVPVVREWFDETPNPLAAFTKPIRDILNTPQHSPAVPFTGTTGNYGNDQSAADEVSPLHLPFEMSFNADRDYKRIKMLGSSSAQCLTKTLDLHLERAHIEPIIPHFQHGMRHTEELDIPLQCCLPALPAVELRALYVRHFFTTIHMLWPICSVDETKAAVEAMATVQDFSRLPRERIPELALTYLIISLGADEASKALTPDGTKYLNAAASLLGHVILLPYLEAVQALLAYTIAYRGRNKDGLAWQMTGLATRIAQSLGLHRHSAANPSREHGVAEASQQKFQARMWAICCCLEKTLQLESGRPSAIATVDDDQLMGDQRPLQPNFLLWNIKLAEHQNGICQHIYGHRPGKRRAGAILQNTSRLDAALLSWTHDLPVQYQPENIMFCSDEHFTIGAYLCIQYHQATITLHRAALIAPRGLFDTEVDKHCANDQSRFRMKGGETIAVNSARSIIRIILEVADRGVESRIHSLGPIILAAITMAIYLMKHPGGKTQSSDLELLKCGLDHINEQYTAAGQDERVVQGITSIYTKLQLHARSKTKTSSEIQGNDRGDPSIRRNAGRDSAAYATRRAMNETVMNPPPRENTNFGTESSIMQNPALNSQQSAAPFSASIAQSTGVDQISVQWPNSLDPMHGVSLGQPMQIKDSVPTFQASESSLEPFPFDQNNMEAMWDWMWTMDFTTPQFLV